MVLHVKGGKRPMGRYDAAGDGPLVAPSVKIDVPFEFDGAFARRLLKRKVNAREAFTVSDPSGTYYRAALRELTEDGGAALPYERMTRSPEPILEITLACAVPARQRMIFVVQKATELGVSRIVPLLTEHSVPETGLEHEKAHAWPGQVIRAAKQCRRSSLPELAAPIILDRFLASPQATADLLLFLDDRGNDRREEVGEVSPPANVIRITGPEAASPPSSIILFTGPEGGFSGRERESLRAKVFPWVLGGRVLRAETAVIVGLTAVQLTWGDFRC